MHPDRTGRRRTQLATFRSRYQSLHYILPDGRSVTFRDNQYSTADPYELAILRDICRAEARGNRACVEVALGLDDDGALVARPVDPFAAALQGPPATTKAQRKRARPSPPDAQAQTTGAGTGTPAADGTGVARAVASADAVASGGQPIGQPIGR